MCFSSSLNSVWWAALKFFFEMEIVSREKTLNYLGCCQQSSKHTFLLRLFCQTPHSDITLFFLSCLSFKTPFCVSPVHWTRCGGLLLSFYWGGNSFERKYFALSSVLFTFPTQLSLFVTCCRKNSQISRSQGRRMV